MPRTITDEQYAMLQQRLAAADQALQVNQFVESIFNDPNCNEDAKRLIKRKYPQMQIPDLDIRDEIKNLFAQEKKQREETELRAKEEADKKNWHDSRQKVKNEYGFTDEGMEELEKMMVDRNTGDYEIAATYHAAKNPKPVSAEFDSFRWNHEKAPSFAEIAKDPEGWGRGEIMKALRADQERARGGK